MKSLLARSSELKLRDTSACTLSTILGEVKKVISMGRVWTSLAAKVHRGRVWPVSYRSIDLAVYKGSITWTYPMPRLQAIRCGCWLEETLYLWRLHERSMLPEIPALYSHRGKYRWDEVHYVFHHIETVVVWWISAKLIPFYCKWCGYNKMFFLSSVYRRAMLNFAAYWPSTRSDLRSEIPDTQSRSTEFKHGFTDWLEPSVCTALGPCNQVSTFKCRFQHHSL